MALEINNAAFQQFVNFAETAVSAGKQKAVARVSTTDAGELGGIANRTITPGSGDWVGIGAGRLASLKKANNTTRDAFMKAVVDMFGGEKFIPESVRNAMKLEDYGKGRPLTARRILVVKAAIDEAWQSMFVSKDSPGVALAKGWAAAEMPRLARAAHFLSAITGVDELTAIERLSTPGTKEFRLMNYGGRFLDSLDNFKNGLRLLDTFKEWFTGVGDALEENGGHQGERKEGMSQTLLSAEISSFSPAKRLGFEKFVFEDIARDPAFDLAETDANRLFGMENNVTTHFFGRYLNEACTQTIAQIPPERRRTFFTAVTMFYPVVNNAERANMIREDRGEPENSKVVVARVLKNLDKIAEMEARGELTFKNLAKIIVPELPDDSKFEFAEVGAALSSVMNNVPNALVQRKLDMHSLIGPVASILEETGCSLEEAIEAATGGKRQPPAPYMSSGTLGLDAFDGTTTAGRARLESDLMRPTGYTDLKSGAKLLPADKGAFTFNFPGEAPIATNGTKQGRKNIGTVMDKIESLCGKMRPQQASSVMTMVSQSALSILKGGLSIYGINADEHSACDFTLSKNAGTGDVTIRYSSHEGLPFKFEWTATVRPDGYVTTTPFKFTDEKALAAAALESKEQLGSLPLSGNAAKEIGRRLLPGSGLAIFKDPGRELKTRMNNIATASVQTYATKAIAGMRKGANGGDIDLDGYVSEFREDLARHAPIRIGDGPLLDTLGAEKARDAYVDFITDGKVKTYAEADRNTRIKASVLMAFSTQGMLSSGMKSVGNAFDANGNDSRLTASMITGTKARKDLVNLSKDEKGNIVVKVGIEFTSGFLILRDEKQRQTLFSTNEGSSIKYDFNVVVTDESLERFAGADWANFDSDANKKIEKDVSVPHSIEKAAEALPGDFKLDLEVDVSFSVNADALAEV